MAKDFGIEREDDGFILWIVATGWKDAREGVRITAEDLHSLGEMVKELEVEHAEERQQDPQPR